MLWNLKEGHYEERLLLTAFACIIFLYLSVNIQIFCLHHSLYTDLKDFLITPDIQRRHFAYNSTSHSVIFFESFSVVYTVSLFVFYLCFYTLDLLCSFSFFDNVLNIYVEVLNINLMIICLDLDLTMFPKLSEFVQSKQSFY